MASSTERRSTPSNNGQDASPEANGKSNSVWSRGGSCIINPLGKVLAGPLWDEEGILYADESSSASFEAGLIQVQLDLDSLPNAKLDFDPVGHDSRHDLLLRLLNEG